MPEKAAFETMGRSQGSRAGIPELGIGLLGYAFMGKAHSNGYLKLPYIFWPPPAFPKLVAVCGRNEKAVAEAAERFGYARSTTDWRDLVDDPEVQIFDNSASNDIHLEPTLAAIAAGKHVICEKPLARNAEEARQMWRAAEDAGVKHMVAFNYRFVPAIRLAKWLIDEGRLGEIVHFRAKYLQEWISLESTPWGWRFSRERGGSAGIMGDLGSHIIDLGRFLIGEPRAIMGKVGRFTKVKTLLNGVDQAPFEVPDSFVAVIEFQNGATGTLEASAVARGHKNAETIEVNGTKGSVIFDLEDLNRLQVYLSEEDCKEASGFRNVLVTEAWHPFIDKWWPHGHIIGWEHTFVHEIAHFLTAVAQDCPVTPFGATFEDGYKAAVVCDAILESSEQGKQVEIRY